MRSKLNACKRYIDNEIMPMFRSEFLRDDIIAALSVTFVAIPLSLAVAIASGVAPRVGLISAVIGGILGALFGGCRLGVTGPAVAMSVLIASTIAQYGFSSLLIVGVICGVLQITFGLLKLGRLAKIVPLSLILAFTAGIGFILLLSQLPGLFQVPINSTSSVWDFFSHFPVYMQQVSSANFWLAILTVLILAIIPWFLPRAYAFVLAVFIPMAIVHLGHLTNIPLVGNIPHNFMHLKIINFSQVQNWQHLFGIGIEVFILASLESLLSTSAVDIMGKGDLHNPNQELIGQGIANIGVAIFGGIPVTGVIARSSVNILSGAKTRRAAILQTLFIFMIIYFGSGLIEKVPMAVLIGILIAAAFKMMNLPQVLDLWQTDRIEVLLYVITLFTIIATDLIDGIQTGLLAAFVIMAFRMLRAKTDIKLWTNQNVLRVGLNGNISILAYDDLTKIKNYALSQDHLQFVIFEFGELQRIDVSGAKHLITIAKELGDKEIRVIFHGMSYEQQALIEQNVYMEPKPFIITITEYQIKEVLEAAGLTHSANDVLRHGIIKYISNYARDNQLLLSTLAKGQKPHTLLITCSDSRLNPNAFLSANIGEIFIVRNVGNVVPPYMPNNIYSEIAAIEFAVHELGVRNIVICAHTECGAVKAAVSSGDDNLGYVGLDNWLSIIKAGFRKKRPLDAKDGVKVNLLNQVENLKTYPLVTDMIADQQITVNAWIYDVHSGNVLEWDDKNQNFIKFA